MGTVADYHASIEPTAQRQALERIADLVRATVPEAVEGTSYAMPAFLYRGKGLLAAMAAKTHLAVHPYSGSVLPQLADRLGEWSYSKGTLRFTAEHPLPEDLVLDILRLRRAQIDAALDTPGARRS